MEWRTGNSILVIICASQNITHKLISYRSLSLRQTILLAFKNIRSETLLPRTLLKMKLFNHQDSTTLPAFSTMVFQFKPRI